MGGPSIQVPQVLQVVAKITKGEDRTTKGSQLPPTDFVVGSMLGKQECRNMERNAERK